MCPAEPRPERHDAGPLDASCLCHARQPRGIVPFHGGFRRDQEEALDRFRGETARTDGLAPDHRDQPGRSDVAVRGA